MKTMNASDFKTKCLAIFDEIAKTGEGVTILKHGKPVAQVLPAVEREQGYPQDTLKGTVEIMDDIVSPVLEAKMWSAENGEM